MRLTILIPTVNRDYCVGRAVESALAQTSPDVDIIVSNILMAMGMMMVSPTVISLPLKLFMFVAVDGWSRLMHGLILSYG